MKLDDLPQAPARPHNFFALDSGVRFVEMDAQLIQDSARLAAQLGLRGADSTYVAVAVRLKLSLFTLDIDQRQCAKRVVSVVEIQ